MNARKLRAVPGCPQPEPPAYKPVRYGAGPWPGRLPHTPTWDEVALKVRAQSLSSRDGKPGVYPATVEEAQRVIAESESASRPARAPVDSPPGAHTSRVAARVDDSSNLARVLRGDHRALPDLTPDEYAAWEEMCGKSPC